MGLSRLEDKTTNMIKKGGKDIFFMGKGQIPSVELEFNYYLGVIRNLMDPDGSFLELGPSRNLSLTDHFENVTIVDKNIEVIKNYASEGKKAMHGDYYSLVIKPNSFDYVVALHPDLYHSGKNTEWVDFKEKQFKFKEQNLEKFVSSLLNIARKKVFIGSKKISDDPPMKEHVSRIVTHPPQFVLYEKPVQFNPYRGIKKWKN